MTFGVIFPHLLSPMRRVLFVAPCYSARLSSVIYGFMLVDRYRLSTYYSFAALGGRLMVRLRTLETQRGQ